MNVSDELKAAWSDVESAGLPEHVQGVALSEALRLRAEGSGTAGRASDPDSRSGTRRSASRDSKQKGKSEAPEDVAVEQVVDDATFFQAIERETGVGPDILERILYLDEGRPSINVPRRMLGKTLKQQQINASALVIVSRHFGLNESEVSGQAVVDECKRLTIFDKNLATNLKNVPGIVQTGGRKKSYKVRTAAIETFESAVAAVSGQPEKD